MIFVVQCQWPLLPMILTKFVVIVMNYRCLSAEPPRNLNFYFHRANICNTTETNSALGSFLVTNRITCAKICGDHSDCQSLDVQARVDYTGRHVCILYRTHCSVGNSSASLEVYHKLQCQNGGMVRRGRCRCTGGYVGILCEKIMKDCKDGYYTWGIRVSGVYKVWPVTSPSPFYVFCIMTWKQGQTLIQKHTLGNDIDFNRTWDEYDAGFGNLSGDHWLGNSHFHYLTQKASRPCLVIEIVAGGIWKVRYYFKFNLTDKASHFRFYYQWSETEPEKINSLGDAFYSYNGTAFSTFDKDNDDSFEQNCAKLRGGGWWYRKCMKSNLNGKLTGQPFRTETDVNWRKKLDQSLTITSTKIFLC